MSKREEFPAKVKVAAFERANGRCESCTARLCLGHYQYDHVIPTALGGPPTLENCQVICSSCHMVKTARTDVPQIARSERIRRKHIGAKSRPRKPMPGSRASAWKHRMDGSWERRDGHS